MRRAAERSIPFRCQDCYRFTDDLSEIETLTAEANLIRNGRKVLEKTLKPENIDLRLATIAFRLVEVHLQVTRNAFYSVGCPGVDSSQTVGVNEPIPVAQCQSPFMHKAQS